MYLCMYICMYYVCVYVCMYVCMFVCMYVSMHVFIYVCMFVCMYVWLDFRKGYRQLQAQCPNTPPPPSLFPNFPVPSSYKNGNCLNIRASLDILDNIHPRK